MGCQELVNMMSDDHGNGLLPASPLLARLDAHLSDFHRTDPWRSTSQLVFACHLVDLKDPHLALAPYRRQSTAHAARVLLGSQDPSAMTSWETVALTTNIAQNI
jgi:hypothetical protein